MPSAASTHESLLLDSAHIGERERERVLAHDVSSTTLAIVLYTLYITARNYITLGPLIQLAQSLVLYTLYTKCQKCKR